METLEVGLWPHLVVTTRCQDPFLGERPARGHIDSHHRPIKKLSLSSQPGQNFFQHRQEDYLKPRLPDPLVLANSLHATPQTQMPCPTS
ncbi:hypothetical protein TNCV_557171 [Trichonephila clavipes]|uniref:Uncharacterized protein n=1 Tax=Trichonephila clavipes TaxID=2585209 RepID=A0A8X6RYF0_TRICX|nr:hypothetical protein TNCV_557171 [Trichonephila clavipes]